MHTHGDLLPTALAGKVMQLVASVRLSVRLFVRPSVRLSVCLSVRPSVRLSVRLFPLYLLN